MIPLLSECENCGSIWSPGTNEWDMQQCASCGWHLVIDIDEDDEFDIADDDDDEDFRNSSLDY